MIWEATESEHYILSPLSLSEALIRLKKVLFTSSTNCTHKVRLAAKTSIYFLKRKAHSSGFPRDMFSGTKVCDHQLLSKLPVSACQQVSIAFGTTYTPSKANLALTVMSTEAERPTSTCLSGSESTCNSGQQGTSHDAKVPCMPRSEML